MQAQVYICLLKYENVLKITDSIHKWACANVGPYKVIIIIIILTFSIKYSNLQVKLRVGLGCLDIVYGKFVLNRWHIVNQEKWRRDSPRWTSASITLTSFGEGGRCKLILKNWHGYIANYKDVISNTLKCAGGSTQNKSNEIKYKFSGICGP